jgi:hypothetical protein
MRADDTRPKTWPLLRQLTRDRYALGAAARSAKTAAGKQSAKDPKYVVRPQRERLGAS